TPPPLMREHLPEARATVADKLGSAMNLAECLSAMMASLLDDKAVLTTEEQATLATIGATMEMRVRDLRDFLTAWTGGLLREPRRDGLPVRGAACAMLHVCRRSLRNALEQDGTKRDAAGYRLQVIPGGCEVRARFC
ncbi:hypothetical protein D7V97_43560, partial [Corallococcus sp. CA053C]